MQHTISRKGYSVKTYFKVIGCGAPIVYLHGWGCDGSIFKSVAERLPDYSNYLLDFAGFGNSGAPPANGFTVFDYADLLAEFLEKNSLKNAVIAAHSFGCRVAMVVAATRPYLINRLLLFAPAGVRRPSFIRWCKVRAYKLGKRFKIVKKNAGSADYQATPPHLKSTFIKVVNQDLSAYARKIACKTLIIAAKQDSAVPYSAAKRVSKLIKQSEFVTVDGDHFALFYAPSAFARIIKLFAEE